MKKVGKISTGVMGLLLSLGMAVNPVAALTKFEYKDWNTADGYYGTKEEVSDVVTKLVGKDQSPDFDGQIVGAYTKASTGALLKDGIKEEVYVELDPTNYENGELFELTVSLDAQAKAEAELTEHVVMTQKSGDEFVLTAGWYDKNPIAKVTKSGVYTYRWEYTVKEDKGYVTFTLLLGDEEVGSTGEVEVTEITADNKDTVALRSVWFCNIKAENGVYVHSRLPQTVVDANSESKVVTATDKDVADILEGSLSNLENYDEIKDLLDVNVKLESSEATVTDDSKTAFEKVAGNGKIAEYLDIEVVVTAGEATYNLHELTKPVSLTVAIPTSVAAVKDGYTRTYYILREHDGKVEKLNATLSEDGKNLTFATDKFSTYALAYEDTVVEPAVDNPTTGDAIMMYASIGLVSMGMLVLGVKTLKKRNN